MFAAGDMLLCSACTQNRWSQRSVSGRAGTVSSRTVQTAVSPRGDMWLVCRPSGHHSWSGLWGRGCWHLGGRAGMLQTVPRCTNSPPPQPAPTQKIRQPNVSGMPGQAVLVKEVSFFSSQGGDAISLRHLQLWCEIMQT